jgi:acyl-CoA reductase-like NAD-dependent aldehyde dehydrogenase
MEATVSLPNRAPERAYASARAVSKQLLIGGHWVPAASGKTFETFNPATGEGIAQVAEADEADVTAAVAAARLAFEDGPWPAMRPQDRARLLLRIADSIDAHAEELAELETLNNGTPLSATKGWMVAFCAELFRYYAGWPTKIHGEINPSSPDFFTYTLREPVGVCGQIIPWNVPLIMATLKLAPALACGNVVVLKPAEQTPLTALRVGELLLEEGVPDGVVNILTGFGSAGAAIARHPGIDKVAFTGSTEVGKEVLRASGGNLKRVSLELGGKSPNVIFADADLDQALEGALTGYVGNQGQNCFNGTRIFVERPIYDEFTQRLCEASNGLTIGDPFDPATVLGPLISREQHERVGRYVASGKSEGATLRIGTRPVPRGLYVAPTIFSGVRPQMRIWREEIFGPVAAIAPFEDIDDAVLQGNDTDYGLAAAVWTKDVSRAHRVARKLRAGTVWINCYAVVNESAPFGGYRQSGMGRELSRHSLDLYTQLKAVHLKL